MAQRYFPKEIEAKWSKIWKDSKLFSPDLDKAVKPYYNLMMFPYPSAAGLHIGNMYAFTGSDVWGRYMRMKGFDVFEPIGLDAFGIHSENYALKINTNPMELAKITEKHFYEQLTLIGNAYDWTRTVETNKPEYYKWSQWLFLQMYQAGLAYRKKAKVNWCPSCLTVLADEQVISGLCERCSSEVIKKDLEQWFLGISKYADRLLDDLDGLDWSEKVKIAQRNWIGRSEGALIEFKIQNSKFKIKVFTTALDTIYGVTFLVLSPEHPLVSELRLTDDKKIKDYINLSLKRAKEKGPKKEKEKTGVDTGYKAENPFTGEDVPIWIADYVLMEYGTGAIMGVPGHDARDHEFALVYKLEVKPVIEPTEDIHTEPDGFWDYPEIESQFADKSILVDSGDFSGSSSREAKEKMMVFIKERGFGERKVHYHLRDWLISRQRYWGAPIPIIYCDKCGVVPVPEKDLPIVLPPLENFRPTGTGQSPLASVPEFINATCPKCGGKASRETDVMDNFICSSWYYLRYPSTDFQQKPFDKRRTLKWLPVEMYIGGAEHSVLHLMYSRFVTKVLHDLGFLDFTEPFEKFRAHGLIISRGAKMSKSKGNVVNPDELVSEYGADTVRTYLMFMGPLSDGGDFQKIAMGGVYRFLNRVWDLVIGNTGQSSVRQLADQSELKMLHKTIKRVTQGIEDLHYNVSIASLMELLNFLSKQKSVSRQTLEAFLKMLAPFAPFITEELWQYSSEFGVGSSEIEEKVTEHPANKVSGRPTPYNSIHLQPWPKVEEKYLEEEEVKIAVSINGKLRDQLVIHKDIVSNKLDVEKLAIDSPRVKKFLSVKTVVKTIYVPGKIINFVTTKS